MERKTVAWSSLLSEAVNKPGVLSTAYSTFHNYSIGNQMLAWSQLSGRGLDLSPIATYKTWQGLGRQVKKGEKILVKVALSPTSYGGAKLNSSEINHWDFEKVKKEAETHWNKEL